MDGYIRGSHVKFKMSVHSALVKYLKQYSTYYTWKHHEVQLKKYYWKRKILWSDGYFVCSVGQVSQTIVKKYIKQQG